MCPAFHSQQLREFAHGADALCIVSKVRPHRVIIPSVELCIERTDVLSMRRVRAGTYTPGKACPSHPPTRKVFIGFNTLGSSDPLITRRTATMVHNPELLPNILCPINSSLCNLSQGCSELPATMSSDSNLVSIILTMKQVACYTSF